MPVFNFSTILNVFCLVASACDIKFLLSNSDRRVRALTVRRNCSMIAITSVPRLKAARTEIHRGMKMTAAGH